MEPNGTLTDWSQVLGMNNLAFDMERLKISD